jgi:class 3 adenylate cyclase
MAASIERKLTTILSADVAGYSRLMSADEAGTLATLKAYRATMTQLIADGRGRIVGTAGDSLLAEFASVVQAVDCAVRIQRELAERNATLAAERQMQLRIGINLGDVMVENDDLYGDGVNIAARLQALADPGGILISGTVFDQVKDKLTLGFDYLGPQAVKNIAAQVPTYRVLLQPGTAPPTDHRDAALASVGDRAPERDTRWHRFYVSAAYAGAVIVLLLAINLFSWDGEPWVQWPTLGILFFLALRAIRIFRH